MSARRMGDLFACLYPGVWHMYQAAGKAWRYGAPNH